MPELFTKPNSVLHIFWKFQVISLIISWNITSLCHVAGKFCWMKYGLFAIKLVIVILLHEILPVGLVYYKKQFDKIFFFGRYDVIFTDKTKR